MIKSLIILLCLFCFKAFSANKTIYGTDSRLDYYEIEDPLLQKMSNSIAAMIPLGALIEKVDYYKLISNDLGVVSNCNRIDFKDQTSLAECSGFLIEDNKLVTSGSCIKTVEDCNRYVWAFGFKRKISKKSNYRINILEKNEVAFCKSIIKRVHNLSANISFTIIELDIDHLVPIDKLGVVAENTTKRNDQVLMMGYPQGLPLKLSSNSTVSSVYQNSFRANLDSAKSSAGSPVFDPKTLLVKGIYLTGPRAKPNSNRCYKPLRRSHSKSYERIMHINQIFLE